MKIAEIYKKYQIPPNLQEHMYRVAVLANLILKHWNGSEVNNGIVKQACLLHDMGNIIKFDFDNFPELLGEEIKNLNYWIQVKDSMVKRYGTDEDIATVQICNEIGIKDKVMFLVENWGFKNFIKIAESDNWEWKIAVYSDHRISPHGITSLKENLKSKQERYKINRPNASHISGKANLLYNSALEIEKDIQKNLTIPLDSFSMQQITTLIDEMESEDIP